MGPEDRGHRQGRGQDGQIAPNQSTEMSLQRGFHDFGRNHGAGAVQSQIVHAILMTRKFHRGKYSGISNGSMS